MAKKPSQHAALLTRIEMLEQWRTASDLTLYAFMHAIAVDLAKARATENPDWLRELIEKMLAIIDLREEAMAKVDPTAALTSELSRGQIQLLAETASTPGGLRASPKR